MENRHRIGIAHSGGDGVIDVGVGEWATAQHPEVLLTQALGSCVGVCLWDPQTRTGGMCHVMLPSPLDTSRHGDMSRFATHAIPDVVNRLRQLGVPTRRLAAKIAGGAAMFRGGSSIGNIGERNVEEVKRQLGLLHIPILAEDTGGSHARTVELHLDTGILLVRSYRYGVREL